MPPRTKHYFLKLCFRLGGVRVPWVIKGKFISNGSLKFSDCYFRNLVFSGSWALGNGIASHWANGVRRDEAVLPPICNRAGHMNWWRAARRAFRNSRSDSYAELSKHYTCVNERRGWVWSGHEHLVLCIWSIVFKGLVTGMQNKCIIIVIFFVMYL